MNNAHEPDILWEYMDRLRWRLRHLPEEQSADILCEIRQHMEDLVAGYEAEGCSPAEAVRMAEEKFGSAESVGSRILGQRARPARNFIVCIVLINLLWPGMDSSTLNWQNMAIAAVVGCTLGVACLIELEAMERKSRSKQKTVWGNIIDGAICIALAGTFLVSFLSTPRLQREHDLLQCAIMAVSGASLIYTAKAIRKYWRRVRL